MPSFFFCFYARHTYTLFLDIFSCTYSAQPGIFLQQAKTILIHVWLHMDKIYTQSMTLLLRILVVIFRKISWCIKIASAEVAFVHHALHQKDAGSTLL